MDENEIGKIVVDGAVQLPQALGPGLLESVCEGVLARRLDHDSSSSVSLWLGERQRIEQTPAPDANRAGDA